MAKKTEEDKLDPKLVKIAFVMLLGMLAPALDGTIVNVAIKTIVLELNSSISIAQWITTVYILAMGIAVPVSGWLVNRFPGKTVYMISLAVFGAGSIGAVFAWNMGSLIAWRVVQGVGAGILLPVMQTVLVRYSGGGKLPRVMAIIGIPTAIIPILGPTIGGLIVNYLPWQWIFIINIPVCAIALWLGSIHMPSDTAVNKQQRLDLFGLLLLSPAFCLIIFGISSLRSSAGDAAQRGMVFLATGLFLLVAYCIYVLHSKKEAPLDIRLFRHKNFSSAIILIFLFGMLSTGTLFILPLYFQQAHQASAFTAGLLLAPQGIGILCTRTLAAKWMEKIGSRQVIFIGLICVLFGTVPLSVFSAEGNMLLPGIILLIRGAGLGLVMVPGMTSVYSGLEQKDIPQGTTAMRIFQQIGGAFGTAVLAIILSHGLINSGDANIFPAFSQVFWWSSAFTAVSFIPVLGLVEKRKERL
jgi:EmrB/QacA subfamily drug resistance transporter